MTSTHALIIPEGGSKFHSLKDVETHVTTIDADIAG